MTIKILVDTSVLSAAHVLKFTTTEQTVEWGNSSNKLKIGGMRRKDLRDPEHEKQVAALPTFNRMALDKSIILATYSELMFEDWQGSRSSTRTIGDLLIGVDYLHLEAAVDRSYFGGISTDGMRSSELRNFCEHYLLNPIIDPNNIHPSIQRRLPAKMYANLCNLGRFREICAHAPKKHYSDLFHVWTGEVNECSYFLTMDKAIANFCDSPRLKDLRCKPIRPLELLEILGIEKLEAMPVESGQKISLFEAWDIEKYIRQQ